MSEAEVLNVTAVNTLYVLFHGLWGFEMRTDKILAHTPIEEEHDFVAGYIDFTDPDSPIEHTKPLTAGHARLLGVTPGKKNDFDPYNNVVVRNFGLIRPEKRFCVVELDLPDDIKSVRNVTVQPKPRHPFGGIVGEDLHPKKVSMVQVFIYSVGDIGDVSLQPCNVHPHQDPYTGTAKIHIFAQPRGMVGTMHARDAYCKLTDLFKLDIVPLAPLFTKPDNPCLPGLSEDDTKNLAEKLMKPSPFLSESGSNCDALVIDNVELSE